MSNGYTNKLIGIIFMSLIITMAGLQCAQASQGVVQIQVNNLVLSCQPNPIILQGRTMVPLRMVAEALGCSVNWQGYDQSAVVSRGNTEIVFKVGAHDAVVNGQKTELDIPACLIQGNTMVPVRFLASQLGRKLDWDGNQQLVIIGGEISKKVRIATEPTYTPFEFTKDGQLQGFDMDIIHAIANQQGMDIDIYYLGFDELIPALREGKADAVISAVAIIEPRKEVVAFSEPYYTEGLCIVTKNNNHVIQKIDDLTGKIIGVEVGSIGNEYANKLKERNNSTNVVCFESPMSMFTQLEIGTLDAVLNFRSSSSYYIKCNEGCNLKVAGLINTNTNQYGIMVRLEDEQLLAQFNSGLQKIQDSGQYDTIYRKWFGNDGVIERE